MSDHKRIQQLDLNLLKVFQTLYVEQNMTRTAEVLHLTPSAVSHAMKRLSNALDDPLFKRQHNKMLPTPMCQRMAPLVIDNLMRLQQSLQRWGEFDPLSSKQHFKIGLHDALEPALLPTLNQLISSKAPKISFSSVKIDRVNLSRELDAGHIDIAVDIALPIKSPVKHLPFLECGFAVLMRKNHPLAKTLSVDNYLSATHLTVSNRPSGATAEDELFQKQGFIRQTSIRCQNYYAAQTLLKDSDQLLTLPRLLGRHLLNEALILLAPPIDLPNFSCHLYWHENTEQDASLSWLRNLFIKHLQLNSKVTAN